MIDNKKIKQFLYWCSGTDPSIIKYCSKDVQWKQEKLGLLLIIPVVMAFGSMSFLIMSMLGKEYLWISLIWAGAIFLIDRYFLLSILKKGKNKLLSVFGVILRFALALIIGYLIAHPLLLGVFNKSIETEFKKKQESTVLSSYEADNNIIRRRISQKDSLLSLNELELLEKQRNNASDEEIMRVHRQLTALRQELTEANNLLITNRKKIKLVKDTEIKSPKDFWQQLSAFDSLKEKDSKLGVLEFLLIIMFIIFDTIPLIAKVSSSVTNYDILLNDRKDSINLFSKSFSKKRAEKFGNLINEYFDVTDKEIKLNELIKTITIEYDKSLLALKLKKPDNLSDTENGNGKGNGTKDSNIFIYGRLFLVFLILFETLFVMWNYDNDPTWLALPSLTFSLSHYIFGPKKDTI